MRIGGAHKCAWLLAIVSSAFLPGCAQITVVSDGQPPKSEWRFGVLAIDVAPSAENTIVSASGFGLITNPSGSTLGYANARIVRLGDHCRVVISTSDLGAVNENPELLRLIEKSQKACAA